MYVRVRTTHAAAQLVLAVLDCSQQHRQVFVDDDVLPNCDHQSPSFLSHLYTVTKGMYQL